MKRTWRTRPYEAGDEQGILKLREAIWGEIDPVRLSPSTWRWQFRDNPAGTAFCLLAEDRGKIVGQYAAIPTRICIGNHETLLGFSCDTMTHPDYRRQGMFVTLATRLYETMAKHAGIETVWGFPNENSLSGFTRRLGWHIVATLPNWLGFTHPLLSFYCATGAARSLPIPVPGGRPLRLPKNPAGFNFSVITRFDPPFDRLWEAGKPRDRIIQVRDSRYLNWRYLGVEAFGYLPFGVYEQGNLTGYVVLRMQRIRGLRVGVLVDLFVLPGSNRRRTVQVLRWVKRFCFLNGALFVAGLIPPGCGRTFRKAGFFKVPEKLSPRKWVLGCREPKGRRSILQHADAWHIWCGDTDIV